MFLSADNIGQLTGYRKPALQRRWLVQNGYSFDVRADGRPVVSLAQYEARHMPSRRTRPSVPDFGALDELE